MTGQLAGRLGEGWATPLENHRAGKDKRRFLSEAKDSLGGDVGICFSGDGGWANRFRDPWERGVPPPLFPEELKRVSHHHSGLGEGMLALLRL